MDKRRKEYENVLSFKIQTTLRGLLSACLCRRDKADLTSAGQVSQGPQRTRCADSCPAFLSISPLKTNISKCPQVEVESQSTAQCLNSSFYSATVTEMYALT